MKNRFLILGFLMVLAFFLTTQIVCKDKEFSDLENRYLEKAPKFSLDSMLSGEYMADLEKYLSDQISFRDGLISTKVSIDRLEGKENLSGVYLGKEGYYVKDMKEDTKNLEANLGFIQSFMQSHMGHSSFLLAPNVNGVYGNLLDDDIPIYNESEGRTIVGEQLKNSCNFIDTTANLLLHTKEPLYFKTDHHWTMRGAYYGYEAFMQAQGFDYMALDQYDKTIVSKDFYGSLYSKAPLFGTSPDQIEVFENPERSFKVEFEDGTVSNSVFIGDNLLKKDQYTYFLDGNHPFMKITSNCESGRKIMIIKDSYAHCLIPFLTDQYSEITIVDLRYYHDSVSQYMLDNGIEDVLMIHNLDFLMTDENFVWLKSIDFVRPPAKAGLFTSLWEV